MNVRLDNDGYHIFSRLHRTGYERRQQKLQRQNYQQGLPLYHSLVAEHRLLDNDPIKKEQLVATDPAKALAMFGKTHDVDIGLLFSNYYEHDPRYFEIAHDIHQFLPEVMEKDDLHALGMVSTFSLQEPRESDDWAE